MNTIHTIDGQEQEIACIGCALEEGLLKNTGQVLQTKYFDVHQDVLIPIPGFLILSTRRHIQSVDEFTQDEQQDYIRTLVSVRRALREELGIEVVYTHQEEDTSNHFHLWILPRYKWMDTFGTKIESVRPIMDHAKQHMMNDQNINDVYAAIENIRSALNA